MSTLLLALLIVALPGRGMSAPVPHTELGTALYCETIADGSTACWESAE